MNLSQWILWDTRSEGSPFSRRTFKNYAIVITTNSGLWRYLIGDTVRFLLLSPYRIRVTGRTKHHINVFGEELMVENTDLAIAKACK
jgi:hypothetical protein